MPNRLRPVWNIFKRRGDEESEKPTLGEQVFYRALDDLRLEDLPPQVVEARARAGELLHRAEEEAFGTELVEIVGRFGRLWYDFIARHDMLPPRCQMPTESMLIARELVGAFAQGSSRTRSSARKVLQLVDQAFQSGNLALCEVLLALFDTEKETRRHNERNVFFDRYTRRMFHQRRRLLTPIEISEFRALHNNLSDGEPWVRSTLDWLDNTAGVRFGARQPDPTMTQKFKRLDEAQRQAIQGQFRVTMPYERFRAITSESDLDNVTRRMATHLVQQGPRESMRHALEAAYFVALSAGKNDNDDLLFEMDPWLSQTIGTDAPTLLSRMHKATRAEDSLLRDALDRSLNEEAARWVFSARFTEEQITRVIESLPSRLRDLDIQSVPEGLYDLEQFVGDLAIEAPQRRLSRRLRLCRYI